MLTEFAYGFITEEVGIMDYAFAPILMLSI